MHWIALCSLIIVLPAQAWLVSWDTQPDWPAGTTVETCLNDNCIAGITGTQQEFTLSIQPGSVLSAKARAQAIDGRISEWATITTVYPAAQNSPLAFAYQPDEDSRMSFLYKADTYYVSTNSGNAGFTTPSIDTTGADLLIMVFDSSPNPSPTYWNGTYFTDSKGNTWTFLSVTGSGNDKYGGIAYSIPTSVGPNHTVSLAPNSIGSYGSLAFLAFAGVDKTSAYDTQTNANDADSPGSITPAVAGELFITRATTNSGGTPSVSSPFTITLAASYSSSVRVGAGAAYYISQDANAVNPTWAIGTVPRGVSMAAFRPAKSLASFRLVDQTVMLVR